MTAHFGWWLCLLSMVAVAGGFLWTRRTRRKFTEPWMHSAASLGFRVAANVSPPRMVRNNRGRTHEIWATFRPGAAPTTLEVKALLHARLPFRLFGSTDAAREMTPLLPRLEDVVGLVSAMGDEPKRARPLLQRMANRLNRLAAGGVLEVTEEGASLRVPISTPVEALGRAIDTATEAAASMELALSAMSEPGETGTPIADQGALLRWKTGRYEGTVLVAGAQVQVLIECSSQGAQVTLASLGAVATRIGNVVARIGAVRSELGTAFSRQYGAWLEEAQLSPEAFATGLRLDTLRFAESSPEAIAYLSHPAFAGHFVEVVLSQDGALLDVTLQG